MKNVLITVFILISSLTYAQDIFQAELFSADMVLKYRDQIGLSDEQTNAIKKVYNENISEYNFLRWDLDAETVKMKKLISESNIDSAASMQQMNKLLILETELKQKRLSMLLSIKSELTEDQQFQLKKLKAENSDVSYGLITPINENPRIVVRVNGEESADQPIYYIVDKKGKRKVDSIDDINPNDIESIEVFKGDTAKEQFGKEAGNGVILIKLKEN